MTLHDYQLVGFNPALLAYTRSGYARPLPVSQIGSWRSLLVRSTPKGALIDALRKAYWLIGNPLARADLAIDTFLCPSPFIQRIAEAAGLSPAIHLPQPTFASPRSTRKVASTERDLRLVFLGRIGAEKGLNELVGWLIELNFEDIEALTVIGDGPDLERVQRKVARANVGHRVHFLGRLPRDEAFAELARHDALVLPSIWYENAPMVMIEAASLGLPVLASRHGSLVDFGDSVGNKVLFDLSATGLRDGMQRLKEHLRSSSLSYSLDEFLVETYAARLKALFSPAKLG